MTVNTFDRYGPDVLAGSSPSSHRPKKSTPVELALGMVLEDAMSGYVGAVVGAEKTTAGVVVNLEDRAGKVRAFPLGPGFLLEGKPVDIKLPAKKKSAPGRTASGSRAVGNARARVARGSRIWVEGKHDAELVEKIWGDDLRIEGVVVEPLGGLDDVADKLAAFGPDKEHRVGVLADHLVSGTKESKIADAVRADPRYRDVVHIIGHPYVDIWQAVKPHVVGIREWPVVPRGEDWKTGILKRIGWPHADHRDLARGWVRILGKVSTIADVEPTLSGRVEELIDFVTVG
ncbi:MAG: DUF3097 domain-containing protein [Brevibacterium aurantiacum]|uniref:DUF3097 domain-containing protein n=1 Tax=Brevibacterium aurantiacum TaxID=273384 RepID=UPI00186958B4|nr:DUF3097 domain-containing protein [Brevibacterium aurantiacum]